MKFEIISSFFDVLFPRLCESCNGRLNAHESSLCAACMMKLPFRINIDTAADEDITTSPIVTRSVAILNYVHGSTMNKLVGKFKNIRYRHLAFDFGRLVANIAQKQGIFDDLDFLIPVPLSQEKMKERGYNQAMEIALGIASVTGLPIVDALSRQDGYGSQKGKRGNEREANIKGAFTLSQADKCKGKSVAIVDDVMTTGATLMQCAHVLEGCAKNVRLIVLARTSPI